MMTTTYTIIDNNLTTIELDIEHHYGKHYASLVGYSYSTIDKNQIDQLDKELYQLMSNKLPINIPNSIIRLNDKEKILEYMKIQANW